MSQSYQHFAYIIDKFPFYYLNFDKNFLKYCKKTQIKLCSLFKNWKKSRETIVSDFLESFPFI